MDYHVIWEIDLEADSPEDAVSLALEIQQDPESLATHFTVLSGSGEEWGSDEDFK